MSTERRKTNNRKQGSVLAIALFLIVALVILFEYFLKFIMLKIYSPCYFVSVKTISFFGVSGNVIAKCIPFMVIAFIIALRFIVNKQLRNRKNIIISTIILAIVFICTIVSSCNVWAFNDETISYNTLLNKEKIVYKYDDIDNVILYAPTANQLAYSITFSDGEELNFNLTDAFYSNDDYILFDESIKDKRTTTGKFWRCSKLSKSANDYYDKVFNENIIPSG